MDVDIDTLRDSAQRSLSATDDSRFLPEDSPVQDLSFSRADTSKKRKKSAVVSVSTKKKTQVFYSDDEASNSHTERDFVEDGLSDLASPLSEVSDDFELDTPPKRGALKAKAGAAKSKAEKAELGQLKGAKAKGLKEKDKEREILMKDERRLAVPPATTSRASSATAQSQPSDLFCNDDLTSSSAVDSLPDASQPAKDPLNQAIPKKRKLPPIKKTKTAISTTTATSTATTTTQKPAPAPAQELPKPLLPVSEQRKQALTGVRDIDLADSKAGGNTPKSGLKNTEERRKELDRMRDEARAKRAEEMKSTFDLQSQADKIARFERRLRAENSTAKMRDEWELERHHRRATSKEEGEA
ncbi:hypothetical protein EV363DRAFT_1319385 [Boletus edulis]|nr:hypothetical protein EV363DRAFT_1319385 [Boletus edulis]